MTEKFTDSKNFKKTMKTTEQSLSKNYAYLCKSYKNEEGLYVPNSPLTRIGVCGEDFWNKFVGNILPLVSSPSILDKGQNNGVYLVTLKEGSELKRDKTNEIGVRICAFDVDNYQHDPQTLLDNLQESGLNYLVYTSHYHISKIKNYTKRLRIFIPLTKEEECKEYFNIKQQIMQILSLTDKDLGDGSNERCNQVQFLPTLRSEEARKDYKYAYRTDGIHFSFDKTKIVNKMDMKKNLTSKSTRPHIRSVVDNSNTKYICYSSLIKYIFEREYSIQYVMDNILIPKGIYSRYENRYIRNGSCSSAGVVIINNKIKSFHTSKDNIGRYGKSATPFDACVFSLYFSQTEEINQMNFKKNAEKFQNDLINNGYITHEMILKYKDRYNNNSINIKIRRAC